MKKCGSCRMFAAGNCLCRMENPQPGDKACSDFLSIGRKFICNVPPKKESKK